MLSPQNVSLIYKRHLVTINGSKILCNEGFNHDNKNCYVCLFTRCISYGDARIAGEGLCSVPMAIEQWGFFSLPHLLWHGASVYDDYMYLRGPVILTPVAERLPVELSLPVLSRQGFKQSTICMQGNFYDARPPLFKVSDRSINFNPKSERLSRNYMNDYVFL